ncbi:hypothetical protein [Sphingopyxis sp. RIFCSPHIGHO2_12_FULL_65_19]|uniref:hypothetical protein n=1 Tax=Sphingopyxis sp. RIFCSPHIGHO2_12_FULL_65_19 TaxID=1802172 RepID=UPI0025F6619F|nr:hypothetical protein [Sphingopyxis sp. RIFCSPHIGHO2_12_FULL_65_19]
MTDFSDIQFPDAGHLQSGFWQPLYFKPNFDTPERLVVAVLAYAGGRWSLCRASALDRLKCLYGNDALVALEALDYGLGYLDSRLGTFGQDDAVPLNVSGIVAGERRAAEGFDSESIARRWIRMISSLHDPRREARGVDYVSLGANEAVDALDRRISRDRLPVLVMERITEIAPEARRMFDPHIHRMEKAQRARLLTHRAFVAFDGQKVAANFSTLKAGRNRVSVDVSKRLMWDLEQHRESNNGSFLKQKHEMFLYHPAEDDPTISERQLENIMLVVDNLKDEGRNRDIGVISDHSVASIAERLIRDEGIAT